MTLQKFLVLTREAKPIDENAIWESLKDKNNFIIEDCGCKRPKPPGTGWTEIPKKFSPREGGHICPVCNKQGSYWQGTHFVDAGAQKFYEGLSDGYEDFCKEYEGVMIKCHWSRYQLGQTSCGHMEIFHDWGCEHGEYRGQNLRYLWRRRPDA